MGTKPQKHRLRVRDISPLESNYRISKSYLSLIKIMVFLTNNYTFLLLALVVEDRILIFRNYLIFYGGRDVLVKTPIYAKRTLNYDTYEKFRCYIPIAFIGVTINGLSIV